MSMANTRESLNMSASDIAKKLNLVGKTNAEVFYANVLAETAKFKESVSVPGISDDAITLAKKPVASAISLYHDEMRMLRLEQLKAMKSSEADLEFLRTQCVNGLKLVNVKDDGWKIVSEESRKGKTVPVQVGLSAYDFVNYVHPTEMNGIKNACVIFADNLVKSEFSSVAGISRKGMSQAFVNLRTRMGWDIDGKTSNAKLAEQLTQIFNFMLRGVEFKAINADVKFIKMAIIQGVDRPDKAGAFLLRNEETIVNLIFRAGYTRINKLAYDFQTQTGAENENVYGEVANKDMAEPPVKKEEAPIVTETTVIVEESVIEEPVTAKKEVRRENNKFDGVSNRLI